MAAINFPRLILANMQFRMRELIDAKQGGKTLRAIKGQIDAALDKHGSPVPLVEPEAGWKFLREFALAYCADAVGTIDGGMRGAGV